MSRHAARHSKIKGADNVRESTDGREATLSISFFDDGDDVEEKKTCDHVSRGILFRLVV